MRAKRRLVAGVLFGVVTVLSLSDRTITNGHAQEAPPAVDELVQWLDRRETEWVATAYLQQNPGVAIPRLLRPGRAVQGHDNRWTPTLLTLAKICVPRPADLHAATAALRCRRPGRRPRRPGGGVAELVEYARRQLSDTTA